MLLISMVTKVHGHDIFKFDIHNFLIPVIQEFHSYISSYPCLNVTPLVPFGYSQPNEQLSQAILQAPHSKQFS